MAGPAGGAPGRRSRPPAAAAARASTPWGASVRALASSLPRATWITGTRLAFASATMSETLSSPASSGGQPHLVNLAPPGDQQFADRLASLDLLAAEALATPGGGMHLAPAASNGPGSPRPSRAGRGGATVAASPGTATARRTAGRRAQDFLRTMTATARQAMPSPRPSAPSPSGRRPFTVTGPPAAADSRRCISSRTGASFGSAQITEQSALPSIHPSSSTARGHEPQQLDRVGTGEGGIGVGEPFADVAEPRRAEHRVGDGVGDGVAVAVADESG